ncbi:MAG: hypothetical protein OEZ23_06125, partial [Gammaproteobacteria bacterium]|nr:hypothetical protein [Gammaproteobacteria bacterium]
LAGPESLERRALIKRAARTLGKNVRVISLPVVLGMGMAVIMERLMSAPPVTRDMLAVLDHDDCIDPLPVAKALGIELTGLNEMLLKIL